MTQIVNKKTIVTLIALSSLGSSIASASNATPSNPKQDVSSNGGLLIGSKSDPYWFQIGGAFRFDQHVFSGNATSKGQEFFSGANFRSMEIDFEGGLGKDLSYTLVTSYETKEKKIGLDDAYLTYMIMPKFAISVGQVLPAFSLESTASSKWGAFFERSMPATTLGTNLGLGVNLGKWDKTYTFSIAAMQPKQDSDVKRNADTTIKRNDRWQASTRFVYRPIYEGNKILQIGGSCYFYEDAKGAAKQFSSHPEATNRNNEKVLDTGFITANNHRAGSLEISAQNGPLHGEIEYEKVFVSRPAGKAKLHFSGYHAQISYVLTGEAKSFKEFNGTFGQVKPRCKTKGAIEIAARYSYLNLNSKDINGGKGKNITLALNYYLNQNIKLSGEYIHANLTPSKEALKTPLSNTQQRKLNIVGLRVQAAF